ncbi:MAG: UDP-glucose 4-epimerase [Edaphobacter sp.]|jgi:CDP-paratose 2-epimerase|nr:UDP-glucose 4-epimerase [Edaphobacter sp.]
MKGGGKFRKVLITGGAGFIGSNLAQRLLAEPETQVRIFDNLSRQGVAHNLTWLQTIAGHNRLEIMEGDVRDADAVKKAVRNVSDIYHLAAQVAVTTSVTDPYTDFQVNALGTFNVLEAARQSGRKPFMLFTSTNKVYGSLDSVGVVVDGMRYRAEDSTFRGVNESEKLDFHSPYGCSKGTADQYVRDYGRIYDLPTVVFRMSCIAGPRQFGNEDQGWVAHFLYHVLSGKPITIYGNGFQVRDILHVHDLVNAMIAVRENIELTHSEIYNLGGGMQRAISIIEMLHAIETETGKSLQLRYSAVRPGDQPLYISDTSKLEHDTGWQASRSLTQTLEAIHAFWRDNRDNITAQYERPLPTAEILEEEVA